MSLIMLVDFLPLHWYGNYKGFREYIWSVQQEYPGMELWLTEVGFPWESEGETRSFFEDVIQYLDSSPVVGKYAWFGSFKVGEGNVGPNSAMLDSNGRLTALGQRYVGSRRRWINRRRELRRGLRSVGSAGIGK
jgi:hypothetical protein